MAAQILLVILQLFVCGIREYFRGSLSRSVGVYASASSRSLRRCHGVSCAILTGRVYLSACPLITQSVH